MIGHCNILNIRYNPLNRWIGLDKKNPSTRGFCNFVDYNSCIRAAFKMFIGSYRNHGCFSYAQIIMRFAPPTENATESYIDFICDKLRVYDSDVPSNVNDFALLIYHMQYYECGEYFVSLSDIYVFLCCYCYDNQRFDLL